jgi:hypothetical protein
VVEVVSSIHEPVTDLWLGRRRPDSIIGEHTAIERDWHMASKIRRVASVYNQMDGRVRFPSMRDLTGWQTLPGASSARRPSDQFQCRL